MKPAPAISPALAPGCALVQSTAAGQLAAATYCHTLHFLASELGGQDLVRTRIPEVRGGQTRLA